VVVDDAHVRLPRSGGMCREAQQQDVEMVSLGLGAIDPIRLGTCRYHLTTWGTHEGRKPQQCGLGSLRIPGIGVNRLRVQDPVSNRCFVTSS
jgi:hypothetical protein